MMHLRKTAVARERKNRNILNFSRTNFVVVVGMEKIRKRGDSEKKIGNCPSS